MICPGDEFQGSELCVGLPFSDPLYPFCEQRWSRVVPCSYLNNLTQQWSWMNNFGVAHGLMLEYSGDVSGYSDELLRPFGENGQNYTFIRCISELKDMVGKQRHLGITSVHLTPSGRVWTYKAPNWIYEYHMDPAWDDFWGWYRADKY